MSKTVIGITAFRTSSGRGPARAALNETYIQAIHKAGGIPLAVPVGIASDDFNDLFARLDGVLLTGGVDINPLQYGAPIHPEVTELDLARDEMEIAMVQWLVEQRKPFLGICRGIEVINVALGGTLYTHISDQLPNALHHPCYPDLPRTLLAHEVLVESDSKLAELVGEGPLWVNSLHHQGIRDLAPALSASAYATDGLVEGIELPRHPYAVAVQWHPEELVELPAMLRLFEGLVAASSR